MIVGFVGLGKVGLLLAQAFTDAGITVVTDSDPQIVADKCDVMFITTPENVIANIVNKISWNSNNSVVHCSGLTSIDVLEPALKAGSAVGVFHPLHNFNSNLLEGASISIEADDQLYEKLKHLATIIKCFTFRVQPNTRELYHSAIPFTQDFVTVLMNHSVHIWESIGINKDDAIKALTHLIQTNDGKTSVDIKAVRQHIAALEKFNKDVAALYKQMTVQAIKDSKNHN